MDEIEIKIQLKKIKNKMNNNCCYPFLGSHTLKKKRKYKKNNIYSEEKKKK
jgi:hypothetical protein